MGSRLGHVHQDGVVNSVTVSHVDARIIKFDMVKQRKSFDSLDMTEEKIGFNASLIVKRDKLGPMSLNGCTQLNMLRRA